MTLAIYDCRFLTAPQVARLFALDMAAAEALLRDLARAGFLAGVRRPVLEPGTPETVYALAQCGANLVASHLGMDRGLVRWRKYHNYVGLPFVAHRLAVNDVRIALETAERWTGLSVQQWRYEVKIDEDIDDPDAGVPPLMLRPDAYALCLVGASRLHFFLEVDMATETHARFAKKIRRYLAYKQSRLFRFRFGGKSFRVLTVAPTMTRMRSLKRVAEKEGAQRAFWFAQLSDVRAGKLAHPIWRLAGEETAAALCPLPEAQAG